MGDRVRVKLVRADLESNRIDFVLAGSEKAYAGKRTLPKMAVKPVSQRPVARVVEAKAPVKPGKSAAKKSAKPTAKGGAKPVAKKPAAKKSAAAGSKGGGAKTARKAGTKKR